MKLNFALRKTTSLQAPTSSPSTELFAIANESQSNNSESAPPSLAPYPACLLATRLLLVSIGAAISNASLIAGIEGDASSVVITGSVSGGYDGRDNDGQTITVKPDASLQNDGDGVVLGPNGALTVEQGQEGVTSDGEIAITPTLGAAGVLVLGNNSTVDNNGLIKVLGTNLADPELASGIDIYGIGSTINNAGTIDVSLVGNDNRGGIGIISIIGDATVTNSGSIIVDNAGGELAEGINVVSTTTVTNTGEITVTGGPGQSTFIPDFFDPFGPEMEVPPTPLTRGINVFGVEDGDNKTLVTNTGQINVSGNTSSPYSVTGVSIENAGDFQNSGSISVTNSDSGGSVGALIQVDTLTVSLSNSGAITADDAILVDPSFMSLTTPDVSLTNSGKLEGHVNLGDGNNSITNESTGIIGKVDSEGAVSLSSNVNLGAGNDTLINSGRITGDLDFGGGNNALTLNLDSQIDGSLTFGDGNDILTNHGAVVGNVQLGAGDDIVNFEATGIFSGLVDGGTGGETLGDTLNLFGTHQFDGAKFFNFEIVNGSCSDILGTDVEIGAEVLIDGECGLTNAAQLTVKSITAGTGNNTITLNESGSITIDPITGKIDLGEGTDSLIANTTGASFIKGDLVGIETFVKNEDGDFTYSGTASFDSATINAGAFSLEDATLSDSNLAFAGSGTLNIDASSTLKQTDGTAITGSNFDDIVNNAGAIDGAVSLGLGDDILNNSGTIAGDIDLGVGNDRLIMDHSDENPAGTAYGTSSESGSFTQSAVEGGDGLDTLELRGTGLLGGFLFSSGTKPTGFEAMEVKGQWSITTDLNLTAGTKLIGDESQLGIFLTEFTSDITGDDANNSLAINFGLVTGDVDFGIGDDTLTLATESSINGAVTGNDGMDTLRLIGTKDEGINTYDGSFASFEKLEIFGTESEASIWAHTGAQSYSSGIAITGDGSKLVNQGSLEATITGDDTANAFVNEADATVTGPLSFAGGDDGVTNSGTITGDIDMGDGSDNFDNTNGTITGSLDMGAGDDSLSGDALGNVSGSVTMGSGDDLFHLTGSSLSSVSKVQGGEHSEGGYDTLSLGGSINAILAMDQVQGFEKAVVEESIWTLFGAQTFEAGVDLTQTGQIANWGQLTANISGDENINLLTNASTGTITGDIDLKEGNDGVWNLGTLSNDLSLGADDDWLINAGSIVGDVLMGEGNDTLDITNGTIDGKVEFGDGDDAITAANGGTVEGGVYFGAGDDSLTNAGTATFDVDFGDGADVLKNADGTITGNVSFGTGNDSVDTADLGIITGLLTLGDGNDTLINTGTYEKDIYFGEGADSLENATGIIKGNLYFEGGDDVLDLMKIGQIEGIIDLGAGNDSLVVTVQDADFDGGIFSLFDIIGGEGDDTIELSGNGTFSGSLDSDLESLGLSGGEWTLSGSQTYDRIKILDTASLVNESAITAGINGDENQNTLTNKKTITGDIDLFEGDDSLTNSGTITGSVNLGTGSDQLNNVSGKIVGNVDFGGGEDVVASGSLGEVTGDVSLGAGNDTLIWDGSALAATSSLSGGEDSDTIRLTGSGTLAADTFSDFESLDVRGPSWTLTGAQTYGSGVLLGANARLTNTDALTADITGDDHSNSLINSNGTLTGNVNFGGGSDILDNTGGAITGDVDFGAGNDTFAASKLGSVSGTISLGAGDDRLQISSGSYALGKSVGASTSLEDGIDTLELQGTGTLKQGDFEGYETLDVNGAEGDASWTLTGEQVYTGGVYLTATSSVLIETGLISNFVGDSGSNKVDNQGTVFTNALGLDLGAGDDTLTNSGNMSGFFLVAPFQLGDGKDSLVNSGTLNGTIDLGNGEDQLANSGTILGALSTGEHNDSFFNTGNIEAEVNLHNGNDSMANSGTLTGRLNLGNDNDLLNNSGTITGTIYSAAAIRYIETPTVVMGRELERYIRGQPDDDTIINTGTVKGTTTLGGGIDSVTNESSGLFEGELTLGDSASALHVGTGNMSHLLKASDRDTLTNRGTITGNISLGSGNNSITVDTGKLLVYGDDSDTLDNFGTITGNVSLGNGNNNISTNSGGSAYFGEDNDRLTNNGTITGAIRMGNGENVGLATSGSSVFFSSDNDTLTNNGTINGDVYLSNEGSSLVANSGGHFHGGSDNDTLVNSGTINGKVHFGHGDDTLVWGVGGVFSNTADGGSGTDTVRTENAAGTNVAIDFGKLTNFEKLVTNGAGTVSLSGKGDIGAVAVNKGALTVNTVLFADVQVTEGAKLQGNGFLFGKVTNVSGNVAPGNSIGHLTIEGDYSQTTGGAFELEVIGSQNDRLTVVGAAEVGGTLNVVSDFDRNDVELYDSFEFLTATNGVSGAFDTVNGDTPYFLRFEPAYFENSIEARLVRDSFVQPEMDSQQADIARALDSLAIHVDDGSGSERVRGFLDDLTWTRRGDALPYVDQLANNSLAQLNAPSVRARQAFMNNVFDTATPRAAPQGEWSSRSSIYDESGTLELPEGASEYSYGFDGAMTAFSYNNDGTSAGMAVGASSLDLDQLANRGQNGRTSLDTAIFFSRRAENGIDLAASVGIAVDKYTTARQLSTASQQLQAKGSANGRSVMAALRAQKQLRFGPLYATGVADLQYVEIKRQTMRETGADELGLMIHANSFDSLKSALGIRFTPADDTETKRFNPSLGLFWDHEFSPSTSSYTANFQGSPEYTFDSAELPLPEDQLRAELALAARLSEKLLLELSYSGTFASEIDADKTALTFRYGW